MPDLKQAYIAARCRNALSARFGCYVAPYAPGEGFCWFNDKASLLGFLGKDLWQGVSGLVASDETCRELDSLMQDAELSPALLEQLNLLVEPVCQIHWWGSLENLMQDEDVFAKDLREAYREHSGGGPQSFGALSPSEQAPFSAFLKDMFPVEG